MKILVCGGRDYDNLALVYQTLDAIHAERTIKCVIHGGARGADACAWNWAVQRDIPQMSYPADWKAHGRVAGPRRNQTMLDLHPDIQLVVAFPGGAGTRDMIKRAVRAGIEVLLG